MLGGVSKLGRGADGRGGKGFGGGGSWREGEGLGGGGGKFLTQRPIDIA